MRPSGKPLGQWIAGPAAAGLLFVAALVVRAVWLDIPFLEPFNNYSRQSMCASVARNFYAHGFNLFYPEIDESGGGPALYNVEMPLYSYLMAIAYKLIGGVREAAARSVSVAFSMGFLAFLFLLVRRASGAGTAFWALAFVSFSPMVVALSRSIQPDITMLFACTAAVYFFDRYRESGRTKDQVFSALFLLLAVLTRPFALYTLLPIAYLAWEREGIRCLRNPRHYLYAAFVALALLWYVYMWHLGRELTLAYEPYRYSPATDRWTLSRFFDPANLLLPAKAVLLHLLTPIGAVLFVMGLRGGGRAHRFFWVWLAATVLYLLLIWRTAVIHPYYFLPLAAPGAYFVAQGIRRIAERGGGAARLKHPLILGAAILILGVNLARYYRLMYFVPADRRAVVEAGSRVNELASADALVVAAYHSSPIQLYYTHRRGWTFDLTEGTEEEQIGRLEDFRGKGAGWFVTTELAALEARPALAAYLRRFPVEEKAGRFLAVHLEAPPA